MMIGTAIKIKIIIPSARIPSGCPAGISRDEAAVLPFGPGVAVIWATVVVKREAMLKIPSKMNASKRPKLRYFFIFDKNSVYMKCFA
jgi:hypothetical protein